MSGDAYEIKVRGYDDQGVRAAHGRLHQRRQCRLGKHLEPDLELFQRVLAPESGKDLFDPLADVTEDALEIGPFDPDLALHVEERLVEEGTELGRVVPRDEDGLAQELGSERIDSDESAGCGRTRESRSSLLTGCRGTKA